MDSKVYIAFLRGINVSGQKKVPMEALRKVCAKNGFENAKTYIQSGNIIFKSNLGENDQIVNLLSQAIEKEFGFQVPILIKSVPDLNEIIIKSPFNDQEDLDANSIYFVMLKSSPERNLLSDFQDEKFINEEFFYTPNCVYIKCKMGYGKAKLNNNLVERRLKIAATTRNYKTLHKILQMAKAL